MQAIFRSEIELYHFLTHVCATAERLVVKASRKRQTTVQILRESVSQHRESAALAMVINALHLTQNNFSNFVSLKALYTLGRIVYALLTVSKKNGHLICP